MATSFKQKAVAELRAAKKIEREQEAKAQAEHQQKEAAKLLANEQRIADKLARIAQPEPVVEEVVKEKPKPKAKPKAKTTTTTKKRGRPAKAKK